MIINVKPTDRIEVQTIENFMTIQIGENLITIPRKTFDELFQAMEEEAYDESESHDAMQRKIWQLENKLDQELGVAQW